MEKLIDEIFNIRTEQDFNELALKIFYFQAKNNDVYGKFLRLLNINYLDVKTLNDIPFLPIELFKSHRIYTAKKQPALVFESSGTTSTQVSNHFVASENIYQRSFYKGFNIFYGEPESYCLLALLPSYLERKNSSLVYMMNHLIRKSNMPDSGFYLDNIAALNDVLKRRKKDKVPTLLLGVSFALLDLAENYPLELPENITIMETGGMKGRRKELTRQELHQTLGSAFGCNYVHSEYGMTELLSQAYSKGEGVFNSPPWMRIQIRDLYDPLQNLPAGKSGGINIIDLANIYSCSFIATADAGVMKADGSFEVLGRSDHSEIRGCNLLVL